MDYEYYTALFGDATYLPFRNLYRDTVSINNTSKKLIKEYCDGVIIAE